MLSKYEPNFASLSPEEAAHVAAAVAQRHNIKELKFAACYSPAGSLVFEECSRHGIGQADVVMSMARDTTPLGVICLEKIVGRPIVRAQPKAERRPRAPRAKGAAVRRSDPRRIAWVGDNPKKPGSKSHARFALYRVGMTIDEFVQAGGSTGDVKWDLERGHIRLED